MLKKHCFPICSLKVEPSFLGWTLLLSSICPPWSPTSLKPIHCDSCAPTTPSSSSKDGKFSFLSPPPLGLGTVRAHCFSVEDRDISNQRHRWSFATQIGFTGGLVKLNGIQINQRHCVSNADKGSVRRI